MRFGFWLASILVVASITGCASSSQRLIQAMDQGDLTEAEVLIDEGLDLNDVPGTWTVPPLVGATMRSNSEAIRFLSRKGARVDQVDVWGQTPLTVALDEKTATTLLDLGANVNQASRNGFTPLMQASRLGSVSWVQKLLEKGAELDAKTGKGDSAIHWAAQAHNLDVLTLYLDRGADVNSVGADGATSLWIATASRLFLDERGALRIGDEQLAEFKSKRLATVKLLLDRGADACLRNSTGKSARDMAGESGNSELVSVLVAAEAAGPVAQSDPAFDRLLAAGKLPAIKTYLEKKPTAIRFVKDENIRLRLIGPVGLRVDDLISLMHAKQKDASIIAKVRANGGAYKKFDPPEVASLKKMGLSDEVISAMISATVERDKNRASEANATKVPVVAPVVQQVVAQVPPQPPQEEKSEECVQLALALKACDRSSALIPLGGALLAEGCKSTARSNFSCSIPIEQLMR